MTAAPSLTLYEHVADLIELLEQSELAGPDGREDYAAAIRDQVAGTKQKIDRCNAALSALENVAQHAGEEIERLQKRKASALSNADRLKSYVLEVMAANGLKKLEGLTSGFTMRCNAPSIEIVDAEAVPAEFIEIRESKQVLKRAIKDAMAQGASVPGCRLVQTLSLVRR